VTTVPSLVDARLGTQTKARRTSLMSKTTQVGTESSNKDFIGIQSEAERLRREHSELKARLSELNSRLYLSPAEELERKQLQKLKLAKKDRLAALLVNYSGNS
jgi:uncharacterized protein